MTDTTQHDVLTIRRHLPAAPSVVFAAWTEPDQLVRWWGPAGVKCTQADVDLRVGGTFRLANQLPDGGLIWISGQYEEVDPPHRLRYTWLVEDTADGGPSTVTVTFNPADDGTDIVITHSNVATAAVRENHELGWHGCIDSLTTYVEA